MLLIYRATMSFIAFLSSLDVFSTLFTTAVILVVYLTFQRWMESRTLPPGPWNLPVIGYPMFLDPKFYLTFCNYAKKYGDIFTIRMGNRVAIVVNNYDIIKNLFVNSGEVFHGKPNFFSLVGWFSDFSGILAEDGAVWREQREFLLSALKDFGFGKGSMARKIQNEGEKVVETFLKNEGKPFDPKDILHNCTANIIGALVFDKQLQYDDPEFIKLKEVLDVEKVPKRSILVLLLPWLRHFPFPSVVGWDVLVKMKEILSKFVGEEIQRHRDTFDENNLRDVVDVYILEAKKAGKDSWMTDSRLQANILSLYNAGQTTVTVTLGWALRLMAVYPQIQQKVQDELDNIVGQARLPDWSDRSKMPFTEATVNEIQRFSCIIPLNAEHCNTEEVHINGYTIPARSYVFANLYSVLYDPKLWKNPTEFDPHNFLDEEGKILKNEAFIPFSIGKRACLGESLARMELFLFFTILVQRFKFTPPDGEVLKLPEFKSIFGGRMPGKYQICAKPRF